MMLPMLAAAVLSADPSRADEGAKGLHVGRPASPDPSTEFQSIRRHALVIGIDRYDNKVQGISDLRYAVRDARAIYDALVDPERGGIPTTNAEILCDDCAEKPTSAAIGRALTRLSARAGEGDLVVVFFSGHGLEESGRAYLLPQNADLDALDYTALERDTFIRQIDRLRAKKVVVILDACHSGGVTRGGKGAGRDAWLTSEYYERFANAQGRAFIASCSGGELSWEDEEAKQGVFTGALVRGLSGRADEAPRDGLVSLSELEHYVEGEVTAWAKRFGKSQRPQVTLESSFGEIPLALNEEYLAERSMRLEARARDAHDLRARIVQGRGLTAREIAQAVALTDKYERGDSLTGREVQDLAFVRKFTEGTIDVTMLRAGISPPEPYLGLAARVPTRRGRWSLGFGAEATSIQGESMSSSIGVRPTVEVGYRIGSRIGLEAGYHATTIRVERSNPARPSETSTMSRNAALLSAGPTLALHRGASVRTDLGIALGTAIGSAVRNDQSNLAATIQARLGVAFSDHTDLAVPFGIRFSNAKTIDPEAFTIERVLFVALAIRVFN